MRKWIALAAAVAHIGASPAALAGWKVMPAGQAAAVAQGGLTVTPRVAWNRASSRPSKKGEAWTLDGMQLNALRFFAGVASGETLVRERDKKNQPLPRFSAQMLAPDIVQLFEATQRIALGTSLFEIDSVEPVRLGGHDGVRFTYHYAVQGDELRRNGEARAAVVGGKLYLIDFSAPALHYFDANIAEVRAIMESATL